jgi:gliding motility-associated lipoprotein GldK
MKQMQKGIFFLMLAAIVGCGKSDTGELVGVQDRPVWKGIQPYGMVYVPSGTLLIGPSDQDISATFVQRPKQISIQGFFMDDTEITNNEYRQFVHWVKDKMAHEKLEHFLEADPDAVEEQDPEIDWDMEIDWEAEELQDMYYQGNNKLSGKKELNIDLLKYTYEWYDWQAAAHDKGQSARNKFIKKKTVKVHPDKFVWVRDFAYSYNEPMTRNYFDHPNYDDYPVVGVDWNMVNAFSNWRTALYNKSLGEDQVNTEDFRLPSEFEWEYAARGGHEQAMYPWGGPYIRNAKGCLIANFKPGRGNYPEDGGMYTVKADAYFPNDYGLYNMAGNVAEWTLTAYSENILSRVSDLNPDYRYDADDKEDPSNKRKVIRGGSWKDSHFFLQNSSRTYEFQDTTKSYIGFRNVLTFLGRSINDF